MDNASATTTPLTFTTRTIPPAGRSRVLATLAERGLLPVEPLPGHTPSVGLHKWRLPRASILSGTFAGVRQASRLDSRELFFGINRSGVSVARQHGRELRVGGGDAVVCDPRNGPFCVVRPAATRLIGIRIPRSDLLAGDLPLTVVPATNPALLLLTRYLDAVLPRAMPDDAALAEAFVRHLTDLAALAIRPAPPESATPGVRAARLAAIKADVQRHLTDPTLSATLVAARHGITVRYLHKLFENEARSFSGFVLDRRLDLAHRLLRDPRYAALTVSRVAHDAGFGDLSYFNRTFRRRYGRTPSEDRYHRTV